MTSKPGEDHHVKISDGQETDAKMENCSGQVLGVHVELSCQRLAVVSFCGSSVNSVMGEAYTLHYSTSVHFIEGKDGDGASRDTFWIVWSAH